MEESKVDLEVQLLADVPTNFTGTVYLKAAGIFGWMVNGIWHRADGPAIIFRNGTSVWKIHGKSVSFEKYFEWASDEVKMKLIWEMNRWR